MSTSHSDLKAAEVPLNYARMTVRDLVQQAYDAGKSTRNDDPTKPSADEVNRAIQAIERGSVLLAHARMEHVAKACGFEGLTEALGYLQTLRANPIADLLREAVGLTPDSHAWNEWRERARAVVGNTAPPPELLPLGDGPNLDNLTTQQEMCVAEIGAVIDRKVGMRPELAADFGSSSGGWPTPEVLSGCAVRAEIQREQTGTAAADPAMPNTEPYPGATDPFFVPYAMHPIGCTCNFHKPGGATTNKH